MNKKNSSSLRHLVTAIACICLALFVYLAFTAFNTEALSNQSFAEIETYQQIGSFIGGILGTAVAALALVLFHASFVLQKFELENLRKYSEESSRINSEALKQQKAQAEEESKFRERSFQLSQVNGQLDLMESEVEKLSATAFENKTGNFAPNVHAQSLFSSQWANGDLSHIDREAVCDYLSTLAFLSSDAIDFLSLGGKHHHRQSLFKILMRMLRPFKKGSAHMTRIFKELNIPNVKFHILSNSYSQLDLMIHRQEKVFEERLIKQLPSEMDF